MAEFLSDLSWATRSLGAAVIESAVHVLRIPTVRTGNVRPAGGGQLSVTGSDGRDMSHIKTLLDSQVKQRISTSKQCA